MPDDRVPSPRPDNPPTLPEPGSPADPWPHGARTEPAEPVPGVPGWWRRRFWSVVVVVTAVLAVTTFLAVLLWPGGEPGPLDFRALEEVRLVSLGEDDLEPRQARVDGDRVFLGAHEDGRVVVFGTTVAEDDELWRQEVPGLAELYRITVFPDQVVVYGAAAGDPTENWVAALDATDGARLWESSYDQGGGWLLGGDRVTLVDRDAGTLRGFHLQDGADWELPLPGDETRAWRVITDEDLAGASRTNLRYDPPYHSERVVLVDGDRSAQVVDVQAGEVVSEAANVASPDDAVLPYRDRLFVASRSDGRLYRFDLDELSAAPQILYTVPETGAELETVTGCGDGRVCLTEVAGEEIEVVSVDTEGDGHRWRDSVPGLQRLIPLGDQLIVRTERPAVIIFDRDGERVLERPGVAARINEANALLFATELAQEFGELSVAGVSLGAGGDGAERIELGQVRQRVRKFGCAWDDRHLVCPTTTGLGVWRFVR